MMSHTRTLIQRKRKNLKTNSKSVGAVQVNYVTSLCASQLHCSPSLVIRHFAALAEQVIFLPHSMQGCITVTSICSHVFYCVTSNMKLNRNVTHDNSHRTLPKEYCVYTATAGCGMQVLLYAKSEYFSMYFPDQLLFLLNIK